MFSPRKWKRSPRSVTITCGKQRVLVRTMKFDTKLTVLFLSVRGVLFFNFTSIRNASRQPRMVSEDCDSQNISTVKLGPFCINFLNSFKEDHTIFSDWCLNKNKDIWISETEKEIQVLFFLFDCYENFPGLMRISSDPQKKWTILDFIS